MADNTPNFDSMTPEEIMAWMESLAKRQGANEGFTTSADVEIPEIDPDSVVIDEPGYVPSEGKDKGKRIESVVARRPAAPPPPPVQPPVAAAPPVRPPVAAAPPAPPVRPPAAPPPPPVAAPAASSTPDFDTMSQDERTRWLETLAKRVGVDENTLMTDGGAEIGYVDPNTKVDWNYTPPEGSKAAKEEAARKAHPQSPAPPPPRPVVQAPPPAPEPAAASGLSWLESLAADPSGDFPNLDLSFMTADLSAAGAAPEAALPPADPLNWLESLVGNAGAAELSPIAAAVPPAPEPSNPMDWLTGLAGSEGVHEPSAVAEPQADPLDWLGDLSQSQIAPEPASSGMADDPIAWMESLVRRRSDVREEELTTHAEPPPLPETFVEDGPGYKPYAFDEPPLQAAPQDSLSEASASSVSFSAQDPSAWLDALASARSSPPPPHQPKVVQPPPAPVSAAPVAPPPPPVPPPAPVELPPVLPPEPEPQAASSMDDIGAALARGELVSSDSMAQWMSSQLAMGAERDEPEELHGEYDPDAEPVKAELPDWLLEQVGPPIPMEEAPKAPEPPAFSPALIDAIVEPPSVENMPDWLRGDVGSGDSELDDIFTPASEAPVPVAPEPVPAAIDTLFTMEPEPPVPDIFAASAVVSSPVDPHIDPADPWVVAFEQEYQQKIGGEDVVLPVAAAAAPPPLAEAALLPETQLPVGETEALPAWFGGETVEVEAEAAFAGEEESIFEEAEAVPGDLPDWLTGSQPVLDMPAPAEFVSPQMPAPHDIDAWMEGLNPQTDVPTWLMEVISTSENTAVVMQPAPVAPVTPVAPPAPAPVAPQPQPVSRPVPVRGTSPAPVMPQAAAIDVRVALQSARTQAEAGQLDEALTHYEQVIRANTQLDEVVSDLSQITEKVKNNPAVFRVLGDGLMRQGKLQAALDTYRKALNQL